MTFIRITMITNKTSGITFSSFGENEIFTSDDLVRSASHNNDSVYSHGG